MHSLRLSVVSQYTNQWAFMHSFATPDIMCLFAMFTGAFGKTCEEGQRAQAFKGCVKIYRQRRVGHVKCRVLPASPYCFLCRTTTQGAHVKY